MGRRAPDGLIGVGLYGLGLTLMSGGTAAVIVAAGRGTRAGGPVPKQYVRIGGRTILDHTLSLFLAHPRIDRVVV
ncbi:2-C-methyl-D-erythritol 4-phosphate cytidylyltransferase, partial [Acinetobacter baumannii]